MAKVNRVLIVGGGIGGLTLAVALRRRGTAFELLEQARAIEPVGAGIGLAANALDVLRRLGLAEAVIARGRVIERFRISDERGRTLQAMSVRDVGPALTQIALHRGALHELLFAAAGSEGVRTGVTARSIEARGDRVEVEASDGRRGEFDLVVGADGIHSGVRSMVFGPVEPRYAGYTCWRFVQPVTVDRDDVVEMWGPRKTSRPRHDRGSAVVRLRDGQRGGRNTRSAPGPARALSRAIPGVRRSGARGAADPGARRPAHPRRHRGGEARALGGGLHRAAR